MKNKIKFILSALLIQGCFFSTLAYASSYYKSTGYFGIEVWRNTFTEACQDYNDRYASEAANYSHMDSSDPNCYAVNTDLSVYPFTVSKQNCTDPQIMDLDTGLCVDPPPDVCANQTQTEVNTVDYVDSGEGIWKDIDGCVFIRTPDTPMICDHDTLQCTVTVTGTGTTAEPVAKLSTDVTATPEIPHTATEIIDNTSNFDTDTTSNDNGDGTTTEVTTDVTSSSNDTKATTTYDGTTITTINSDGTQTTTTTVTTTIINADGSTTSSTSTNSQTSAGGTTTTTTNINTGQTTTTSNGATTSNTSGSSTQTTDIDGNITSQSLAESSTEILEPLDPNDASAVPSEEGFVNGDYESYDSSITSLSTLYDTNSMSKPTLNIVLNSLGTCDNANYSATIFNSVFAPDICKYIIILQSVLYWFFAASTAIYLFIFGTSLMRHG